MNLSNYNNSDYNPGSKIKRGLWYICNRLFFRSAFFPFSSVKALILRIFGARVGRGVIIKPRVNIKYPWFLKIGDFSWIGEEVWIDNLAMVTIGSNTCLSQGALILCGNHDYTRENFDLRVRAIEIEEGVWIGAKAIVTPGAHCKNHSILAVGSVSPPILEPYGIYRGNPAILVKTRKIQK